MTKISVIIPAYNEEAGIKEVITGLKQTLQDRFDYEILVVDDGSTDATASIASSAGARVLKNPGNIGYGASLKRAIEAASHEYLVMTDADGTYPVGRIPDLVAKLEEGFDMAVGMRTGKYYWAGILKNPPRLFFKWLSEFVAGRKIPDPNSGLRAFRKSKVRPFFPDLPKGFSFTTTISLIFMLKGHFVTYLPINYYARKGRAKVKYVRDALKTLQLLSAVIMRYNPFKLFFAFSLPVLILVIVFLLIGQWLFALLSFYFFIFVLLLGFFASMFSR